MDRKLFKTALHCHLGAQIVYKKWMLPQGLGSKANVKSVELYKTLWENYSTTQLIYGPNNFLLISFNFCLLVWTQLDALFTYKLSQLEYIR